MTDETALSVPADAEWLVGGGEMGKCIQSRDWSKTPLGPIESWPQSLRTTVSLALASNFPISIAWGPGRVQIYNDGYWPICGAKHPRSMGQDFKECWASAWPVIGDAFESATAGQSGFLENQRIFIDRNGYLEETFFTFSFSPIRDETGHVAGLFHPVTEVTAQALAERRLDVLREVADESADARTVDAASALILETLGRHQLDVPFALIYLLEDAGNARLAGTAHLDAGSPLAPRRTALAGHEDRWRLAECLRTGEALAVENLAERCGGLDCGPYPEPPPAAMALPISVAGLDRPLAVLVAGASPRRPFDAVYRTFYAMLQETVTKSLVNARSYEEERKRVEKLAELDRARTRFFSNVSHEFRTPLTLMLGPAEDALEAPDGSLRGSELETVHRNALRLLKLVNTMLDFSRIEAGRSEASFEETDLAALTADLASVFRSAVERAGLTLTVDCPPLEQPAWVDRDMWEKIVLNLISNAFKFTFEGDIRVSLGGDGDRIRLAIQDTGIGIPPEELPRIFERFHRVPNARSRTFEGTGIGLSLVQELVKQHGGSIEVQSAVGEGTTFTFSVPAGNAHLPKDRLRAAKTRASTAIGPGAYVEEALRWLPDEPRGEERPAAAAPSGSDIPVDATATGVEPARVLVADDNADMRQYLQHLLGRHWTVETAADGAAALDIALRDPPDLVLADIMMPGLDGYQLLERLRGNDSTREVPILLLSARAGEEARVEGMRAGADDYLVKPFSARELIARVGAQLRLSRLRAEAGRALRESEERLRALVNASSEVIYRMSPDWSEMRTLDGRGFIADTKHPRKAWLGEYIYPDDQALVMNTIRESVRNKSVFELEHRVRRVDGSLGWTLSRAVPLFDEHGEIAEWFGTATDVTVRKQAEETLREADRAKDEFLAMLGHELRNPLAPLRTGLDLLRQARGKPELFESLHPMMDRQLDHLVRLVDDLLDIARISRGRIALQCAPLDLRAPVEAAVEQLRPMISKRRHTLTVERSDVPLPVDGDFERLTQVLANLLANAARYTEPGGKISVASGSEGGTAVVTVRDTGYGIAAERIASVFELFSQIPEHRAESGGGGLGVGLALSRRLVELHEGSIEAHSAGPGCGSEFTVRLPLNANGAAVAVAEEADEIPGTARRVLIVDDNADAAESLRMLLELKGHAVRTTSDGPAALEHMEYFNPEIVLLDLGLPGMDGFEVARRIRTRSDGGGVFLIAVTGLGHEEHRQRTTEAGFDEHLTKPVESGQLSRLINGRQEPASRDS